MLVTYFGCDVIIYKYIKWLKFSGLKTIKRINPSLWYQIWIWKSWIRREIDF